MGDGVRGCDGNVVADKEVRCSEGGAEQELRDLHGREGTLDRIRYADSKGRKSVVSVLGRGLARSFCAYEEQGCPLTIKVWMNEFNQQNIQMGGDIQRIPAHMQSMAPAW